MKNKKLSALLLAASMLVALVVPVHAETETTTVLTQNNFTDEQLAKIGEGVGKTVNAYPTEGFIPTVDVTNNAAGFCERITDYPALVDGAIADQSWSVWGSTGQSFSMVIDLGGIQEVESVLFWNNSTGGGTIGGEITDTLWESYKDTFDYASASFEVSTDGIMYDDGVGTTTPVATAETTWFQKLVDGKLDRVFHMHELKLAKPVKARYIKLTVTESDWQFRTAEVAVLGNATAKEVKEVLTGNNLDSTAKAYAQSKLPTADLFIENKYERASAIMTVTQGRSTYTSAELQDGVINTRHPEDGWGDSTAVVEIDLGKAQQLENVFIWKCAGDFWQSGDAWKATAPTESTKGNYLNNNGLRSVVVKTSDDGKTWTEGETITATQVTADDVFLGGATGATHETTGEPTYQRLFYGYNFALAAPVTARYIQLDVNYKNACELSEIMLVGKMTEDKISKTVISGNGVGNSSANIVSFYSNLGVDITLSDNVATYTSTGFNDQTAFDTKMKQGVFNIPNGAGANCLWGNYWSSTITTTIDLQKVWTVSGVDYDSWWENSAQKFSSVGPIEVSVDGETYTTVAAKVSVRDADGNYTPNALQSGYAHNSDTDIKNEELVSLSFAPVKARYVKVTAKGGSAQIVPNEIVVFGELPATATTPVFVDSNGNNYVIDQSDSLNATTTFSGCEGTLIVAWYDRTDALQKIYVASGTGAVSINVPQEDELAFLDTTDNKMKAFAFESVANLDSLGSAVAELNLGK